MPCNHRDSAFRDPCLCCLVFNFCNGVRYRTQCLLRKQGCPRFRESFVNHSVLAQPKLTLEQVRALAIETGFTEAGLVALPHEHDERDAARFAEWVAEGRAGTMGYLERKDESGRLVRSHVAIPFPWARSAIVCFANYNTAQPRSTEPASAGAGWIARYAWSCLVMPTAFAVPATTTRF